MRPLFRVILIVIALVLAMLLPFLYGAYREIYKAQTAASPLEAAEHYRTAAGRIPWRPDLYESAGNNFYAAGDYASADAVFQKASERNALSDDGWAAWGNVIYLNGDAERAAQVWGQALEMPNASVKSYSGLAELYQRDGKFEIAAQFLQKYLSVHAEDASAHYRLGLLLTLSDPNEAFSQLTRASQLDPEFDPAVQTLRTALNLSTIDTTPSEAKVIIGRGLGLVEEWELARVVFEDAVALDETNAEALAWLGEANQQTGREDAFEHLERALVLDPNSAVVRGLRGLYFQRAEKPYEALIEFQSAAMLDPKNPNWYVSVGDAHEQTGDLILAVEAYQIAVSLAPGEAHFLYLLADLCARNNAYVKDVGIPAAHQAVRLAPDDPAMKDMLGWLLMLDGRLFEAEQVLGSAIKRDPTYARAYYHLALLALQRGDEDAIKENLERAIELGSAEAELMRQQYAP